MSNFFHKYFSILHFNYLILNALVGRRVSFVNVNTNNSFRIYTRKSHRSFFEQSFHNIWQEMKSIIAMTAVFDKMFNIRAWRQAFDVSNYNNTQAKRSFQGAGKELIPIKNLSPIYFVCEALGNTGNVIQRTIY